jgi:hypothetical protein
MVTSLVPAATLLSLCTGSTQRVLGCGLAFSAVRRQVLVRLVLASISIAGALPGIGLESPDQKTRGFVV